MMGLLPFLHGFVQLSHGVALEIEQVVLVFVRHGSSLSAPIAQLVGSREADMPSSLTCLAGESRGSSLHQNDQVLKLAGQSYRSRRHRAQRAAQVKQEVLW